MNKLIAKGKKKRADHKVIDKKLNNLTDTLIYLVTQMAYETLVNTDKNLLCVVSVNISEQRMIVSTGAGDYGNVQYFVGFDCFPSIVEQTLKLYCEENELHLRQGYWKNEGETKYFIEEGENSV